MEKLKPCPCCGSKGLHTVPPFNEHKGWDIWCAGCHLSMFAEDGIARWNRRVHEPQPEKKDVQEEILEVLHHISHTLDGISRWEF